MCKIKNALIIKLHFILIIITLYIFIGFFFRMDIFHQECFLLNPMISRRLYILRNISKALRYTVYSEFLRVYTLTPRCELGQQVALTYPILTTFLRMTVDFLTLSIDSNLQSSLTSMSIKKYILSMYGGFNKDSLLDIYILYDIFRSRSLSVAVSFPVFTSIYRLKTYNYYIITNVHESLLMKTVIVSSCKIIPQALMIVKFSLDLPQSLHCLNRRGGRCPSGQNQYSVLKSLSTTRRHSSKLTSTNP